MKKISIILCLATLFVSSSFQGKASDQTYAHYHIIDIDHPISFEEIQNRYEAHDSIDGNITEQIVFQSDYEIDYMNQQLKVYDYPLHVSITNSRGKQRIWNDIISVRDFTAPQIFLNIDELSIDVSVENLQEKVIQNLTIVDNWDKEFFHFYWSGLEETKQGIGTYIIGIGVFDQSNNSSNMEYIKVHLFESIPKHLSSKAIYVNTTILNEEDLIQLFLKNNAINFPYKTITVTSNYLITPQKNGIYQGEFRFFNEEGILCIYQCKIINQLQKKQKKDKSIIYLSSGIMMLIFTLGIILYRKRR